LIDGEGEKMNFIQVDLKTGDGGFLIPEDEKEIADKLLKDPKYTLTELIEDNIYDFQAELFKLLKGETGGRR